jgi:hypothetical protein
MGSGGAHHQLRPSELARKEDPPHDAPYLANKDWYRTPILPLWNTIYYDYTIYKGGSLAFPLLITLADEAIRGEVEGSWQRRGDSQP